MTTYDNTTEYQEDSFDDVNMSIPFGTQLSFWDDWRETNKKLIFSLQYCVENCMFDGVYQAKFHGNNIFAYEFGNNSNRKWLVCVQYRNENRDDLGHYGTENYILEDMWEAFRKIEEVSGMNAQWRLPSYASDVPSMIGH